MNNERVKVYLTTTTTTTHIQHVMGKIIQYIIVKIIQYKEYFKLDCGVLVVMSFYRQIIIILIIIS